jgi:hypothetical protein
MKTAVLSLSLFAIVLSAQTVVAKSPKKVETAATPSVEGRWTVNKVEVKTTLPDGKVETATMPDQAQHYFDINKGTLIYHVADITRTKAYTMSGNDILTVENAVKSKYHIEQISSKQAVLSMQEETPVGMATYIYTCSK